MSPGIRKLGVINWLLEQRVKGMMSQGVSLLFCCILSGMMRVRGVSSDPYVLNGTYIVADWEQDYVAVAGKTRGAARPDGWELFYLSSSNQEVAIASSGGSYSAAQYAVFYRPGGHAFTTVPMLARYTFQQNFANLTWVFVARSLNQYMVGDGVSLSIDVKEAEQESVINHSWLGTEHRPVLPLANLYRSSEQIAVEFDCPATRRCDVFDSAFRLELLVRPLRYDVALAGLM